MPKVKPTHYRDTETRVNTACNITLGIRKIEWTTDYKDTTCDNCIRTNEYKRAKNKVIY